MRHDPAGASIVIMLRCLKLYGMAQAVDDLVAQGAPAFEGATPMLSQLLKAEIAECEVRSIAYQTRVARFPSYKDLAGFDFKSSDVKRTAVSPYGWLRWVLRQFSDPNITRTGEQDPCHYAALAA